MVSALFFIAFVEATFMVISADVAAVSKYPLLTAIRMINIALLQFFQRIDLLFLILWLFSIFCTLTMNLYAASEFLIKLIPKINKNLIIFIIIFIAFIILIQPYNIDMLDKYYIEFNNVLQFDFAGFYNSDILYLIISKVKKYV